MIDPLALNLSTNADVQNLPIRPFHLLPPCLWTLHLKQGHRVDHDQPALQLLYPPIFQIRS
jgi:hypothetical protein